MSNPTENTTAQPPKLKEYAITRNSLPLQFTWLEFGKKSDNAGLKFPAPQASVSNLDTILTWFGNDYICKVLNRFFKKLAGDIYISCLLKDDAGNITGLDEAEWTRQMIDITEGEATISDLEEEYMELSEKVSALSQDEAFADDDNMVAEITRLSRLMKPLRKKINDLKEKAALRVATRKINKEKADAEARAAIALRKQQEESANLHGHGHNH